MEQRITLSLALTEGKPIPPPYRRKWSKLVRRVRDDDVPHLIFLGELLGLLDHDPNPQFSCVTYTTPDMFGGRDQEWTLRTRHACIYRVIRQDISEEWQHLHVEADEIQITGLPDNLFIRWNGALHLTMKVVVGNLPAQLQPDILMVARELFARIKHRRVASK